MNYDYPTYTLPHDIYSAIQDGRATSITLIEEAHQLATKFGFPISLESIFSSVSANKHGRLRHFWRETIHDNQALIVKESGYQAARAVLAQTIATDSCAWVLAQEVKKLSPQDLDIIKVDYISKYKEKGPRLIKAFEISLARYNPTYSGDKRIKALFRVPGMLTANEDPHQCEQALSTICAPNQNL